MGLKIYTPDDWVARLFRELIGRIIQRPGARDILFSNCSLTAGLGRTDDPL
jgi:hypothetical protein